MKKLYFLFIFSFFISVFSQQKLQSQSDFYFYENKGQIIDQKGNANSKVKYLFNSGGLNVQIKKEGFSYDVYEVEKTKKKKSKVENSLTAFDRKPKDEFDYKFKFHRVDIDFLNANKNPEIIAEGKSTDYENYYNIPHKPEGVTEVHRYQKITYKNIYPNVDLVFFKPKDTAKTIEYNFIIHPKGKISDIKLKFKGAKTKLKDGKLSMNLRFGEMQENIPHSWIEEPSKKTDLSVQFKEIENGVFGFAAPQDSFDKTVVIDPVPTRIWKVRNSNGSHHRRINKIVEKDNSIYTLDIRLAQFNIATNDYNENDWYSINYGYFAKFDANGNKIYGVYIGNHVKYDSSNGTNDVNDFAIDQENNIYIVGSAADDENGNNTITTPGAYKEHSSKYPYQYATTENCDGFILKLSNQGIKIWGTYFGDESYDTIINVVINSKNEVIFTGAVNNTNYISESIINAPVLKGPKNFYIAHFEKSGKFISAKKMSLYNSYDGRTFLAIDTHDNLYLGTNVGYTFTDIWQATPGTHQIDIIGNGNTCLMKFNKDFKYEWGTFYGGLNYYGDFHNIREGYTSLRGLEVNTNNEIIIAGVTNAIEKIATLGTHQNKISGNYTQDMFITKFNANGKQIWGTYYGDDSQSGISNDDNLYCLSVDENDNIFIGGYTGSKKNISTPNSYLDYYDIYNEGFFSKFSTEGKLIWGSYYEDPIDAIFANKNFIYTFGSTNVAKFYDCNASINIFSNSPVCPNTDIKLQASGGTSYSWTGPNGFTSIDQNPIIPNATSAKSGTYSCVISGAGSCDGTFTVEVKVEDKTPPNPDIINLPDITGDCHTVVSTTPTATDICSGKITATTTDPLQYSIPGTYTITWNYDDGNGNTFSQTQKVIITSPALPTATSPQTFCAIDAPKISNISITGQNIIWYDDSGNVLNTATPLIDGTTYYASQTINGCESDKIAIQVKVNATPLPTGNANQDFCTSRNAQIKDLAVTGSSLKFYDSLGNVLPNTTVLQNNTSYFVTQTINNCESPKLEIKVTLTANSLPANDYQLTFCNDTTANSKTEDLRKYQENIIIGSSTYSFEYFDQNNNPISDFANRNLIIGFNIFNVKVKSADGCWKMVQLKLQLNPKPVVNLPANAEFCRGLSVNLDAGSGFKSYVWTKEGTPTPISNAQVLNVSEVGKYTVEVTNSSDCKNTSSTLVNQSILANILKVEITNNDAKVLLSANGDFVYSLDNSTWQNNPEFPNLNNGSYTVYVKTKLGCIIGEMNFTIFDIPNTFTPNSDGVNDTWKITGMENYPNSEITIVDRFGTAVLKKIINGTFEWNGQINGRILPTGTYWYVLKVSDGRILQGYVLIKNRN